ncbi:hypothetical protein E4U03_12055 [Rothia nasimurium]|uniref:Uncharacterized protein n=1 Tax=Rothia nasimurium TaxID=85336 RepID=A0A4Y9F059_9MICC|nr:hypothetical protein [Rothia nasimurium]MBF0809332.1 hypothetical protein [Rothia nasimurium]TFU19885.1 hypothetical protein E4U03_12055 [Rothia nasimurium]
MTDLAKKLARATTKKESSGRGVARTESTFRKPPAATRKFTFNIDEEVYQQLRKQAFEQERDMTAIINETLSKALG